MNQIEKEIHGTGGEAKKNTLVQGRFLNSFKDKSREDLIEILVNLQRKLESDNKKISDLEEYVAY